MTSGTRDELFAPYDILDTQPEPAFDDAVMLARHVCAAPIALVSLVTDDRQWFKARDGIALSETGLESSVCRFVVASGEMVVIPDLALDDRTRDNPLVRADPALRFYAGAPLTGTDGAVLGALCVIDTVPRPGGLSGDQQQQLAALARSVSQQLELRRAWLHCHAAVSRLAEEEHRARGMEGRWAHIFRTMSQGLIVATLVRDAGGIPVDWRFDEVNAACKSLVGLDPADVVGRTVLAVRPDISADWIDEPARAVASGETARFTREAGRYGKWFDGVIQPTGGDAFLLIFNDVTDQLRARQRLEGLAEIADRIRESRDPAEMTRVTAAAVGRILGLSRAGYGEVDEDTQRVTIEPDWTAAGIASIAGSYRFEDFGQIRDELARAEPLVIDDVTTDPRTSGDPAPMQALEIAALVNMPVREQGRTVAVFIAQSRTPRRWTRAELAFIRSVADRLETGIARHRVEALQAILNREIAHRLKNSLAMVQAIANQTLRGEDPDRLDAFQQRLRALGTAHDVLLEGDILSAELGEVIRRVLDAVGAAERAIVAGPLVPLGDRATLSTSLLMHELATNALKYGALSGDGRIRIEWRAEGPDLVLDWTEEGGPPAVEPDRRGFGTRLLTLGLIGTGGASLCYGQGGFAATFRAALDQMKAA